MTNKMFLTGLGAVLLSSTTAYAACTTMPTCSELGYNNTSCPSGSFALKCPFDKTKLTCVFAFGSSSSTIVGCRIAEKVTIGGNSSYVCTQCHEGYVLTGGVCAASCLYTNLTPGRFCSEPTDSCKRQGRTYFSPMCKSCLPGYKLDNLDYFCSWHKYNVGDFFYDSANLNKPLGVVFYQDDNVIKIIALDYIDRQGQPVNHSDSSSRMAWIFKGDIATTPAYQLEYDVSDLPNYCVKEEAQTDMNGKDNTDKIIRYASRYGSYAEAAAASSFYHPASCLRSEVCGNGKWYLPSAGEWEIIGQNGDSVFRSLINASKQFGTTVDAIDSETYLASSECSSTKAWGYYTEGTLELVGKNSLMRVLPALEIRKSGQEYVYDGL